jgi:hypothetical protein
MNNKRTALIFGEDILFSDDIGLSFNVGYNIDNRIELQCMFTST